MTISRDSRVSLREITPELRSVVSQLAVRDDQVRAEGFYKRLGFEHTGVEAHGELEMRLAL